MILVVFLEYVKITYVGVRRGHVSYQNVVFGVGLDDQNIAFSKFRKSENTVAGCLV